MEILALWSENRCQNQHSLLGILRRLLNFSCMFDKKIQTYTQKKPNLGGVLGHGHIVPHITGTLTVNDGTFWGGFEVLVQLQVYLQRTFKDLKMLINEFIYSATMLLFPWCFKGLYHTVHLSLSMGNVTQSRNWYQYNYCAHVDLLECHLPFLTCHLIWTSPNLCRWATTSTYSWQLSRWIFLVGLLLEGGKCLLQKRSMRSPSLFHFLFLFPFYSPFPLSCACHVKHCWG